MPVGQLLANVTIKSQQSLSRKDQTLPRRRKLTRPSANWLPIAQKSDLISGIHPDDLDALEFRSITDSVDPASTTTESLARIHESTAPLHRFKCSTLKPSTPNLFVKGDTFCHMVSKTLRYQSCFNLMRKLLSTISMKNLVRIFRLNTIMRKTWFILHRIAIFEWIEMMPAVFADCHVWIDISCWFSIKVQSTRLPISAKHLTVAPLWSYSNKILSHGLQTTISQCW